MRPLMASLVCVVPSRARGVYVLFAALVLMANGKLSAMHATATKLTIYPAPTAEPRSQDYELWVNDQPVFCYTSFRYDSESTSTIAGRPVSPVSFCSFDFEGEVRVEVRLLDGLRLAGIDTSHVIVRPLAHNITPEVNGGRFQFMIREPCQLSIEPCGSLIRPLHLFANPIEIDVPAPDEVGVRYFGPGMHELSEVELTSNSTVYIAGGAIVNLKAQPPDKLSEENRHNNHGVDVWWSKGLFGSTSAKQVTIRGRGILCGRRALEKRQRGHLIRAEYVEDLTIEGIVVRECSVWSMYVTNCRRVHISNVKIIGHYVNNDGIPIGGTSDALVENCFTHNADDSLQVKVWIPQRNVTFRNCVVWNDIGGSLGLMHESYGGIENVAFENCTVIHSTDDSSVCPVAGLKLSGPGSARNFRFENIVIEDVRGPHRPPLKIINNWDEWHRDCPTKPGSSYELLNPPKRDKPSGAIRDVLFRNVRVLKCHNTDVVLMAEGPDSLIENVTFDNVVIAGKRLVTGDTRIKTNAWVKGVVVK
ncbi:MAG: glycosyl hydrolase family 28 protein [Candidatus Sumerlaeaceae bacterium]